LRKRRDRSPKITPTHLLQRAAMWLDHGANALNDVCQTIAVSSMSNNERISPTGDIAAKVC
jgi:hypothetical protein